MLFLAQESGAISAVFRSFEDNALWVILLVSIAALVFAAYLRREVLAAPEGTEKMKEIARAIQVGSKAYLNRQFRVVGVLIAIITIVLYFAAKASGSAPVIAWGRAIAFLLGSSFSATVGFVGMRLATIGNLRVATAAQR